MRSAREILFRLKQEARNVQLLALPPKIGPRPPERLGNLPAAEPIVEALQGTLFVEDLLKIAADISAHRFPIFDVSLDTGPQIDWRRDYQNGITTQPNYFRLVPYLDVGRAGDHKNVWELNRHQHLVLLAQAYLFTKDDRYLQSIFDQLEDWWRQNPFQRGINSTSALEVAFRAFSWIWVYHWAGHAMSSSLRRRFLNSLYQHGCHIENNLSFYFSPNTHLLGEAVVLHALGFLFPHMPRAARWGELGRNTVEGQMLRQVHEDGSHFEQSTYYHVYALDMFLFHATLAEVSPGYREKLSRMADFLQSALGSERSLPFIGDDDGGRWFHPYGPRDRFGRATLATCAQLLNRVDLTYDREDLFVQAAWWLGTTSGSGHSPVTSRLFPNSGLAFLEDQGCRAIVDGGSFGPGRAGHSHSDTLSVVAGARGVPILIDAGTYTYMGSAEWRNKFRGSIAHNTIRVNGQDQAVPAGPFGWSDKPAVRIIDWNTDPQSDTFTAEYTNRGITHRRVTLFIKPNFLLILDRVSGPSGEHTVEQFWNLASDQARQHLIFGSQPETCEGWQSKVFGQKQAVPCLVIKRRGSLPMILAAAVCLDGPGTFQIREHSEGAEFEWHSGEQVRLFSLTYANGKPASTSANFTSS